MADMKPAKPAIAGAVEDLDRDAFLDKLAMPDLAREDAKTIERKDRKREKLDAKAGAEPTPMPTAAVGPVPRPEEPPKTIIDLTTGSDTQNVGLLRWGIKSGAIRLAQIPEEAQNIAQYAIDVYTGAIEQGKQALALQALKLVNEINLGQLEILKVADKAQRLDDGKPTSITATKSPEDLERIRKIVAGSKGPPPPELVARAAAKAGIVPPTTHETEAEPPHPGQA